MFGKIIFVVDVEDDVIGIQARGEGSLGKCGMTGFEIEMVLPVFRLLDTVISLSMGLALETWVLRDKKYSWLP